MSGGMLRRLSILAILLGTTTAASAGSYVSLGVGGDPALQGDLGAAAGGEGDGANGRLALGQSFGRLSLEASLSRFGFGEGDITAAGVHLRLGVPLSGAFGGYGRVGLERVWLGAAAGDQRADGVAAGIGLEYRLSAPLLGQAAFWGEVSQDRFEVNGERGGARLWTLGVTVGL